MGRLGENRKTHEARDGDEAGGWYIIIWALSGSSADGYNLLST